MNFLTSAFFSELPGRVLLGIQFEAARYAMGTLGVFFGICVLLAPFIKSRKIRHQQPPNRQIRTELLNSLRTICVFVALDILVFDLAAIGVFKKYDEIAEYGYLWFLLSIPLAIVLHDAYFYWTHRAMHHPKLFRLFHLTHHRSNNPTPFTAYSFAVGEAIVEYAYVPMMMLVMPIHGSALAIVLLVMIFKNATGHCGYELFPRATTRHPLLRHLTTVTHHDMHHQKAHGNYGFYFTWWDRWMDTEHSDYQAHFEAVTGRSGIVAGNRALAG